MPRLRLIAGPNGSGKTTLARYLIAQGVPLGQYVNPDDVAKYISFFDVLHGASDALDIELPCATDGLERFAAMFADMLAQRIAVGLRSEWVDARLSLTYESVMSHESHLEFVDDAKNAGFESYLYYICTNDSFINQERVGRRVLAGGHGVPADKIISRYKKSLALLHVMANKCKRAYFFDNSGDNHIHFAEITPDGYLDIYQKYFDQANPDWFVSAVLEKWDHDKVRLASL
ncbi:zeta toxin family protein [Ectothiorhodospira shaposhnikovii]|uniref:zeta toxin family protein n=1 Tax=Ectothiorhodospira shaposhnikovii TaxID=1054 RepID=UPI0039A15ECB